MREAPKVLRKLSQNGVSFGPCSFTYKEYLHAAALVVPLVHGSELVDMLYLDNETMYVLRLHLIGIGEHVLSAFTETCKPLIASAERRAVKEVGRPDYKL